MLISVLLLTLSLIVFSSRNSGSVGRRNGLLREWLDWQAQSVVISDLTVWWKIMNRAVLYSVHQHRSISLSSSVTWMVAQETSTANLQVRGHDWYNRWHSFNPETTCETWELCKIETEDIWCTEIVWKIRANLVYSGGGKKYNPT